MYFNLSGIATEKCSKQVHTYRRESQYQKSYVFFPLASALKRPIGATAPQNYPYSFGEARYAPLNRCIYVRYIHPSFTARRPYIHAPRIQAPRRIMHLKRNVENKLFNAFPSGPRFRNLVRHVWALQELLQAF